MESFERLVGVNFNNEQFTDEIILSDRAVPHTALELHAASLQQDGHEVRGEPAVDGSVGILRVRVRAGLGRQQVRGDAERAGREEDV